MSGPASASSGRPDMDGIVGSLASEARTAPAAPARQPYPFTAIVGQEEMTRAMVLAAVDPGIGGVLILGDRGTGKSTAVRALAALLPEMSVVAGCRFGCDPTSPAQFCESCRDLRHRTVAKVP